MDLIIGAYNEKGSFILTNGCVYWFNGKRFEFWCLANDFKRIIYNNGFLYGSARDSKCYRFENKKWQRFKFKWTRQYALCNLRYDVFDIIYEVKKQTFYITGANLIFEETKLSSSCGYISFCIPYQNHIYCFGVTKNEMYDIENKCWSEFPHCESVITAMLIKDEIYIFTTNSILKYNPISKTMTTLNIKTPFIIKNTLFSTSE